MARPSLFFSSVEPDRFSLLFSSLLCFFLDFLDESESEESEGKNLSVAPKASPKVLELPPEEPEGFLLLEGPALLLAGPGNKE